MRLDKQVVQHEAEHAAAEDDLRRAERLHASKAIAEEQYVEARRKCEVAEALLESAQFQKRHREVLGTREAIAGLDAEAELARREKDLAETQATLQLMEAGSRPEEIEAQNTLDWLHGRGTPPVGNLARQAHGHQCRRRGHDHALFDGESGAVRAREI